MGFGEQGKYLVMYTLGVDGLITGLMDVGHLDGEMNGVEVYI